MPLYLFFCLYEFTVTAQYTEADIQNALADIQNGVPRIPRTTLCGHICRSQYYKVAYSSK